MRGVVAGAARGGGGGPVGRGVGLPGPRGERVAVGPAVGRPPVHVEHGPRVAVAPAAAAPPPSPPAPAVRPQPPTLGGLGARPRARGLGERVGLAADAAGALVPPRRRPSPARRCVGEVQVRAPRERRAAVVGAEGQQVVAGAEPEDGRRRAGRGRRRRRRRGAGAGRREVAVAEAEPEGVAGAEVQGPAHAEVGSAGRAEDVGGFVVRAQVAPLRGPGSAAAAATQDAHVLVPVRGLGDTGEDGGPEPPAPGPGPGSRRVLLDEGLVRSGRRRPRGREETERPTYVGLRPVEEPVAPGGDGQDGAQERVPPDGGDGSPDASVALAEGVLEVVVGPPSAADVRVLRAAPGAPVTLAVDVLAADVRVLGAVAQAGVRLERRVPAAAAAAAARKTPRTPRSWVETPPVL